MNRNGVRPLRELIQMPRQQIIDQIRNDLVRLGLETVDKVKLTKYFDKNWTFYVPITTTYADGKQVESKFDGTIVAERQVKPRSERGRTSEVQAGAEPKVSEVASKKKSRGIRDINIENIK